MKSGMRSCVKTLCCSSFCEATAGGRSTQPQASHITDIGKQSRLASSTSAGEAGNACRTHPIIVRLLTPKRTMPQTCLAAVKTQLSFTPMYTQARDCQTLDP